MRFTWRSKIVPIHRGAIGFYDIRDLTLASWQRMGARGAFIELNGCGGLQGMYVIEVPGAGAITPEKHLYEEVFYVLEGRGTTEVWGGDGDEPPRLRVGTSSVFTAPLNTWHRIVNATNEPALILVATNAPPVMELYDDLDFVFGAPHVFSNRYDGRTDYFEAWKELGIDEVTGRAINAGAIVPDVVTCEVPHSVVTRRRASTLLHSPWWKRLPRTRGGVPGRAVFEDACPRGWPGPGLSSRAGLHSHVAEVGRHDPVGGRQGPPGSATGLQAGWSCVSRPGGADWFHAHFATTKEPFRVMAWLGGYPRRVGLPGSEVVSRNIDIKEGGNTIEYRDEDPQIRKMFQEQLAKEGAAFDMPEEVYR